MVIDVTSGSAEPPWWRAPKHRSRSREPLTRDAIVDAAVHILDTEGLDALTVRHLGDELGTGSATLYWHITGKDELFELVYDRIMADVRLPQSPSSPWQDQLKELGREVYRVMGSHRDAVRLSLGRVPVGPSMLRIIEWSLELLRGAGIPDPIAAYFGDLFGRYLDASVIEAGIDVGPLSADTGRPAGIEMVHSYFAQLPADQFPNVVAMADEMFSMDVQERFELGLDILIRGLAAYVTDPSD